MARRAIVDSAIFSRRLLRGAHVLDRPLPPCAHDGGEPFLLLTGIFMAYPRCELPS